jgi:hypothetical protein
MEIIDPYGFVVHRSDNDLQEDRDLVHEHCGTVITRIEPGDNFGSYIGLMNDHSCPADEGRPCGCGGTGDHGVDHGDYPTDDD